MNLSGSAQDLKGKTLLLTLVSDADAALTGDHLDGALARPAARGDGWLPADKRISSSRRAARTARGLHAPNRKETTTMTIKVGDSCRNFTFMTMGPDGAPKPMKTGEVVRRQKLECSRCRVFTRRPATGHMVGFVQKHDELKRSSTW